MHTATASGKTAPFVIRPDVWVTTAYTGANRIENYNLSSNANDYFKVNNGTIGVDVHVNLTGAGSDFLALNDTNGAAFNGSDVRTTLTNFTSGAGGDIVQLQKAGASISSGGFELVTAANEDINAGNFTIVINSNVHLMDDTWTQAEARTALDAGIGMIAAGTYTAAIYFAGGSSGAYLMGFTTAADDPGNANVDLIGVLSSVAVNTLASNNFS